MTFFKRRDSKKAMAPSTPIRDLFVRRRSSRKLLAAQTAAAAPYPCCPTKKSHNHKRVRFTEQLPVVHSIPDHVRPEEEELVWYPMDYLQLARKEEIKNTLRAQYYTKGGDVEDSEVLTWRGIEDILEQSNRQDKVNTHVQAVLRKFRTQPKSGLGTRNAQTLRSYSRDLSKADRRRADALGVNDELVAHGQKALPLPLLSAESKRRERTLSGLSWTSPLRAPNMLRPHSSPNQKMAVNTMPWRLLRLGSDNKTMVSSTRTVDSDDHDSEKSQ